VTLLIHLIRDGEWRDRAGYSGSRRTNEIGIR